MKLKMDQESHFVIAKTFVRAGYVPEISPEFISGEKSPVKLLSGLFSFKANTKPHF